MIYESVILYIKIRQSCPNPPKKPKKSGKWAVDLSCMWSNGNGSPCCLPPAGSVDRRQLLLRGSSEAACGSARAGEAGRSCRRGRWSRREIGGKAAAGRRQVQTGDGRKV